MPYICLLQDMLTQLNFTFDMFKHFASGLCEESAHVSLFSSPVVLLSCLKLQGGMLTSCNREDIKLLCIAPFG